MWYPVSDEVASEPVSMVDAQAQVFADEEDFDTSIEMLISSARAHVESYCNRQFAAHSMVWACDSFADLRRLPAAPATEITGIAYVDLAGDHQALDPTAFTLRADGLDPWIAAAAGVQWPQIQPGSRITITGTFGGTCPADVKHAMLLLIGDGFTLRENTSRPVWTSVDALLANHRRGAWG